MTNTPHINDVATSLVRIDEARHHLVEPANDILARLLRVIRTRIAGLDVGALTLLHQVVSEAATTDITETGHGPPWGPLLDALACQLEAQGWEFHRGGWREAARNAA